MNKVSCLLLATVKNAGSGYKRMAVVPYTRSAMQLCSILYRYGYISYFKKSAFNIEVGLKYFNGIPVIKKITLMSKPSRRLFISRFELMKNSSLNDFIIVSTELGLMTSLDAYAAGIGGQIICKIN